LPLFLRGTAAPFGALEEAVVTDGSEGRASRRTNPLSDLASARDYVERHYSKEHALLLARGADVGVFFANTMKKVFELEKWSSSTRNRDWLKEAGGDFMAAWSRALRDRGGDGQAPAAPSGGFTTLVSDLLDHAQQVYALSNRLAALLVSEGEVRSLVDACTNELAMLAVFATRAARAAGLEPPGATELAALAVWIGIERETGGMYSNDEAKQLDEKERRVDKYRKIIAALPVAEEKVTRLTALS
jgi:hypothetical protein